MQGLLGATLILLAACSLAAMATAAFRVPALLWGTVAIQWPALLLLAVSPQLALLAQLGLSRVREFDARAHPTLAGIG